MVKLGDVENIVIQWNKCGEEDKSGMTAYWSAPFLSVQGWEEKVMECIIMFSPQLVHKNTKSLKSES